MSKTLALRLPETEAEIIARYAAATQRTRTEIIREFVRSLEIQIPKPAKTKRRA
jgi:predicted DNA-binding protein